MKHEKLKREKQKMSVGQDCIFNLKKGILNLFFNKTTTSVVLDCCDVNIIKVVLLQPPGGEQELDFETTTPGGEQELDFETTPPGGEQELDFETTEWALTVSLSRENTTASLSGDNSSSEIKIYYETKPESRSLHWR